MDRDRIEPIDTWAPLDIYTIGPDGRLLAVSTAGPMQRGLDTRDAGRRQAFLDLVSPEERPRVARLLDQAFAGRPCDAELTAAVPVPGRRVAASFIPCCDTAGRVERLVAITRELPSRQGLADRSGGLDHTLAVLARARRTLERNRDEPALLQALCTDLVAAGGYGFAWIGYASRRGRGPLRLMAQAGVADGAFAAAICAAANTQGASACRAACDRAEPVILRDLARPDVLAPWAEAARPHGLRSMIALPLGEDRAPFGHLSLFAEAPDAFDAPRTALLAGLAADLVLRIRALRTRDAEARAVRRAREEAEREVGRQLAANLHDGAGQTLQGLNLGLKHARDLASQGVTVPATLLDRLVDEVGTALQQVRAVSRGLRPPNFDRPPRDLSLADAVRHQCDEIARHCGTEIRVHAEGTAVALDARVQEQCFIALREALYNAIRHARATHILVALRVRRDRHLSLLVLDDGVGFDADRARKRPTGIGLSSIRERIAGVRGRVSIRSRPGRGTLVRLSVPLARGPIQPP